MHMTKFLSEYEIKNFAKLEGANSGVSIEIDKTTIVGSSSGNSTFGLAQAPALPDLRFVCVDGTRSYRVAGVNRG